MKTPPQYLKTLFISVTGLSLALTSTGFAQATTATQVERSTRQTDIINRPENIRKKFLKVPEAPPQPPPEAAKAPVEKENKFFVKNITLEGIESFPPEIFSPLLKPYENRDDTLTDLENLSRSIQREYLKRGIVAAVFVPEQKLEEGNVALKVLEAKMGEVIVQPHPYFNSRRLYNYWQLPTGSVLRVGKISKSIQLMNKNPDREVSVDLRAGKKPGTTDVLLTAQTHVPVHPIATFDNEGSPSTGRSRTAVGFRDNNLLGLDDSLLSEYVEGRDFSAFYAYHSVPVNMEGASFLYGYSSSESGPKETIEDPGIRSESNATSVSLHQDIFREDTYFGEVFTGFDANDKTVTLNAGTFNRDRLRIFNAGTNLIHRGVGNSTSFSGTVSQGIHA
jgi:hemolysin activation/secretion protein